MGYLTHTSPVADDYKMLIEIWTRVPQATFDDFGGATLLEWGLPFGNTYSATWSNLGDIPDESVINNPYQLGANSFIVIEFDALTSRWVLGASFSSAVFNYQTYTNYGSDPVPPPNPPPPPRPHGLLQGPAQYVLTAGALSLDGNGGVFVPSAWNHALISVDASSSYTIVPDGTDGGRLTSGAYVGAALNDVDLSAQTVGGAFPGGLSDTATWQNRPNAFPGQSIFGIAGGGACTIGGSASFPQGPSVQPQPPSAGTGYPTFPLTFNPWKIAIAGFELGIPSQALDVPLNGAIEFYRYRIWTGRSLNLSDVANRRLFIDANRRPVDQKAAVAALGLPAYDFRRNRRAGLQFSTNNGAAGPLTQVGTVGDFSPGPPGG